MRSSRCALGTAALALAVTTLVGCGGDDDSGGTSRPSEGRSQQAANTPLEGLGPDEVRDASIAAMKELTSMRMDATSTQDGQETHFDVFMHVDGHCTGTMGLNGVEGEVRSDGEHIFLSGERDFWLAITGDEDAADQTEQRVGDRWARFPMEEMGGICSLSDVLGELGENTGATVELGDVVDHDGRKALEVTTSADGDKQFGLVAWEGEPYLLAVRNEDEESGSGTTTLSQFNEPVEVDVPGEGEYVDLD